MAVTTRSAPAPAPRGRHGRRLRRRPSFWVGLLMLLAGLGALGWVAWQVWGTTYVAVRAQQQVTHQLQTQWRTTEGVRLAPRYVPEGSASALVRIPRFGKGYVVPVVEGVGTDELSQGFGHFTASADPGQVGNYALAAHRITHGQPLRRMPDLRPGDTVVVETQEATYTYVLDTDPRALVVPLTSVWVVDPLPANPIGGVEPAQRAGQRLITLTTCAELFHTDDRMIAFGHLVRRTPKPGA